MSLAWNTKRLIEEPAGGQKVEYHFLSGRRLRDGTILSADPDHSSAGQWVVRQGPYAVSVLTRPTYVLPQELCLSFRCHTRKLEDQGDQGVFFYGPPVDEVAFDFAVLLSLFARHPVVLLGVRRLDDQPVIFNYHYDLPRPPLPMRRPPDYLVNPVEMNAIIDGIGSSEDHKRIDAVFAAMRLYYSAIASAHYDPSGAYISLVAALETLAAHHYEDKSFPFSKLTKFDPVRPTLEKLRCLPGASPLVEKLERTLAKNESAVSRKLRMFVVEFLPDEFWTLPDELRQGTSLPEQIRKDELDKRLGAVYRARSRRTHAGSSFPAHTEFGTSDRVPPRVMAALFNQDADGTGTVPSFGWFERMTQMAIMEYLRRSFAPSVVTQRSGRSEEKARLLEVIGTLDPASKHSLQRLAHWTARFLNFAVINPMAPNSEWADGPASVQSLNDHGIIGTSGDAMSGHSWLKNRDVGETVGEFFYGAMTNPFRDNEILLPVGFDDANDDPPRASTSPPDLQQC
jgi:hypothetical protein